MSEGESSKTVGAASMSSLVPNNELSLNECHINISLTNHALDGSLRISVRDVLVLFLSNGQLIVCKVVQTLQK